MQSETAADTRAVYQAFIGPMRRWFNDPPSSQAEGFFADLAEDLAPYTEHQLTLGAASIRRARSARTFPTIRECIDACEKMPAMPVVEAQPLAGKKTFRQREIERQDEWGRRKEAERLCRCDLGRQADKEMWLTALLDFAKEHQRLPERGEIAGVERLAHRANERVHELWQAVELARTVEDRNDARVLAERIENLRKRMHERAYRDVFGGMPL